MEGAQTRLRNRISSEAIGTGTFSLLSCSPSKTQVCVDEEVVQHLRTSKVRRVFRPNDSMRLTAAGQMSRAQSQPPPEPAIPRLASDRPLHLQQRPLNSGEPHEGAVRLLPAEVIGSSRPGRVVGRFKPVGQPQSNRRWTQNQDPFNVLLKKPTTAALKCV